MCLGQAGKKFHCFYPVQERLNGLIWQLQGVVVWDDRDLPAQLPHLASAAFPRDWGTPVSVTWDDLLSYGHTVTGPSCDDEFSYVHSVKFTLLTTLNKKSIKERSKWNYSLLQGLHKEPLPATAPFSKPHIRNKQYCFQRIHLIPAGQGQLQVVRSVLTFRNGSDPDSADPLP